jgi:hypothetical protein
MAGKKKSKQAAQQRTLAQRMNEEVEQDDK